jgi:hypothetical protein
VDKRPACAAIVRHAPLTVAHTGMLSPLIAKVSPWSPIVIRMRMRLVAPRPRRHRFAVRSLRFQNNELPVILIDLDQYGFLSNAKLAIKAHH